MGFRIVMPETVVLPLSSGKTITVKRQLSTGEERAHLKRSRVNGVLDPLEHGFSLVVTYLLDWASADGLFPAIRGVDQETLIATLNGIHPKDFIEVKKAIEAHLSALPSELEEEKKTTQTGELASSATWPSPSASGGATSGLVS